MEGVKGAQVIMRFLRKLKLICRQERRESVPIRDQKPRMLSPEARCELKRLQQDCDGDRDVDAIAE